MINHFQNDKVKHSLGCSSVACSAQEHKHCSIYHFDTKTDCYNAETLNDAAKMWIADGAKELLNVGRVG